MDFKEVDNKFTGKRCFILGSAPSILEEDLSLLETEYVMTLNNSFQLVDYGLKKYQFYNIGDSKSYGDLYKKIKTEIPTDVIKFYPQSWLENEIFIRRNNIPLKEEFIPYVNNLINTDTGKHDRLSNNIMPNNFYEGWCGEVSVIIDSVLLCHFMGFDEIYLLGADLHKEPGKPTHFFGTRKRGKKHLRTYETRLKTILTNLSNMFESKNKKFVNLSRNFKFIECMDIDTLNNII